MVIIGITGLAGSGKGTITEYLVKKYGFKHFSVRKFLIEEIHRRGLKVNRDSMIAVADDFRKNYGSGYLLKEMYNRAKEEGVDAVLESIRATGEVEELRQYPEFVLWGVDAPIEIRYERNRKRGDGQSDMVSFEKFKDQEERETLSGEKHRGSIKECVNMANVVFDNSGTREDLKEQVDKEIQQLLENKEGYKQEIRNGNIEKE